MAADAAVVVFEPPIFVEITAPFATAELEPPAIF